MITGRRTPSRRDLGDTHLSPSRCSTRGSSALVNGVGEAGAAVTRAAAGRRGRPGSRPGATCSGPTSRTTGSCAGTRRTAPSRCSASPPTTPTATPSTARAASSPASISAAASRAPSIDGTITVLADRYKGKRLNSPNDVVVKSDGSIWFTDPAYGIDWDYEGERAESEIGALQRLSHRSATGRGDASSPTTSCGRTASPSRPTNRSSTSPTPAPPTWRTARATSASSTSWTGKHADGRRSLRHLHGRAVRRLPPRRGRPDLDLRGGRRALLPPGRHADRQDLRARSRRECLLRRRHRNRLFICGTTSLYSYFTLVRGAKTY